MNVVEAEVADGRVGFAGLSVPLAGGLAARGRQPHRDPRRPPHRPAASGGGAGRTCPRITVRPDVIEELGGVSNLLFPLDAPRVTTDATRAAIEAVGDDDATLLADDRRARFCASIDGRRQVVLGEEIELAVDHRHLHFFDPETGVAITSAAGVAAA